MILVWLNVELEIIQITEYLEFLLYIESVRNKSCFRLSITQVFAKFK